MRKIKIETWQAKVPKYEGEKIVGYEDKDENLLSALNMLLGSKKPEEIPRGLDKFRLFGRLSKAFIKAEEKKELWLEEADYSFLKKMIESDVPSVWGFNENLSKAIDLFINAEEEKQK